MSDKMEIWDRVAKTNPKDTKGVNQRGGFTSVCAQSQIMAATREFGPIGVGWGYDVGAPIFPPNGGVIVPVTLWHGNRENSFGPMLGCALLDGKRVDTDAPKKATTDAITKLLSHLGFNADVFLGLFEDNKYVKKMEKEFSEKEKGPPISNEQHAELTGLLDASNMTVANFLKVSKIKNLTHLPASKFDGAKGWITQNAN